jgi:hypothetical protein
MTNLHIHGYGNNTVVGYHGECISEEGAFWKISEVTNLTHMEFVFLINL